MAGNGRGQMIIELAGERNAIRARHQIGAGPCVREHLDGDPRRVHGLEARLADIG